MRATWLGWLIGVPLIILLALIGELVGIGGSQVIVGAGMGGGIGLMQARVLRGILPRVSPWLWSCIVGLALPFALVDLASVAGWTLPYSLQGAVAVAGLTAGAWQARILRGRFSHTRSWVPASVVGWSLSASMVALSDYLSRAQRLRGVWGALWYLTIITGGGLVLGLVTGLALVSMLKREPDGLRQSDGTTSPQAPVSRS
jgi:hypothetical protein